MTAKRKFLSVIFGAIACFAIAFACILLPKQSVEAEASAADKPAEEEAAAAGFLATAVTTWVVTELPAIL